MKHVFSDSNWTESRSYEISVFAKYMDSIQTRQHEDRVTNLKQNWDEFSLNLKKSPRNQNMILVQILVICLCKHQCNQIHNPQTSADDKYNVQKSNSEAISEWWKCIQESKAKLPTCYLNSKIIIQLKISIHTFHQIVCMHRSWRYSDGDLTNLK